MEPDRKRFLEFVNSALPKGRYAVALNADDYVFIRRTVPSTGFYKGRNLIQRQAADRWRTNFVFSETGKFEQEYYAGISDDMLRLIVMDYKRAAMLYAQELGECARCGIKLTDEQSRLQMVGPECVKHWPWMPDLAEREREKAVGK